MELKFVEENDAVTVFLSGKIDSETAPDIETELKEILKKTNTLFIDMSEVIYISSAGLRIILASYKYLKTKSGNMIIKNANEDVRQIFTITGLIDVFNFE